jgi:hypothetical protein
MPTKVNYGLKCDISSLSSMSETNISPFLEEKHGLKQINIATNMKIERQKYNFKIGELFL